MGDRGKTKKELINELTELRSRNAELEAEILSLGGRARSPETDAVRKPKPAHPERIEPTAPSSEEKFRSLIQTTPEHVCVIQDGVIKFVNFSMAKFLGLSVERLTGKYFTDFVHPDDREALNHEYSSRLAGHNSRSAIRFRCPQSTGKIRWLEGMTATIHWEGRAAVSLFGHDVSKRTVVEEALRQSEKRYRELVENAYDIIYVTDLKGNFVLFNQVGLRVTGYSTEEIIRTYYADIIRPDYKAQVKKFYRTQFKERIRDTYYELPVVSKDGGTVWIGQRVQLLMDGSDIVGFQAICRDISDRKIAEEALRQSEDRYRAIFNTAAVGINLSDRTGKYIKVNATSTKILGYSEEELEKLSLFDITHPEDLKLTRANADDLIAGKITSYRQEKRYVGKNGEVVWVEVSVSAIRDQEGNFCATLAVLIDITAKRKMAQVLKRSHSALELKIRERTAELVKANEFLTIEISERKNAEKALRENEAKFRSVFEQSPNAIVIVSPSSWMTISANPAACRMFNCPERTCGSDGACDFNLTDYESLCKFMKKIHRTGGAQAELSFHNKAGEIVEASVSGVTINKDGGNEMCVLLVRDITDRKRMEAALAASEKLYRLLSENSFTGIFIYSSKEDKFIYLNQRLGELLGYSVEEMINTPPWQYIHPDDHALMKTRSIDKSETDTPVTNHGEFRMVTKSGGIKYVEDLVTVTEYNGTLCCIGNIIDITARKLAEQELMESFSQLTSINEELKQFAYVTSHDLKEPLRNITTCARILEDKLVEIPDPNVSRILRYLGDAARRMNSLIDDLLAFSRIARKEVSFQTTEVRDVIVDTLKDLSVLIKENDAVVTFGAMPTIPVETSNLRLLFQNLLSNAIKFCKKTPRIHISSKKQGNHWLFSIKDNGIGIETEYFERIFQIFQRLHPSSEYSGTGIGLAIAKKIVERHKGGIWVESEFGKGSTFHFTLPEISERV